MIGLPDIEPPPKNMIFRTADKQNPVPQWNGICLFKDKRKHKRHNQQKND